MAQIKHGTVKVILKEGENRKPRTIPATLWNLPNSPFRERYVLAPGGGEKPVGVAEQPAKPGRKPAKAEPTDDEPQTNGD